MRSISSSRAVTITIGSCELSTDRPAEVEAVGVGELEVENREPDVVLLERQEPLGAAGGPDHPEAVLLEIGANERRDVLLVLDEQDRAAPRRSAAHAPARLSTLTTSAGASAACVTATTAPGRATMPSRGEPEEAEARAPVERRPSPCRRRRVRSVIAAFVIAVTTPRSVIVAGAAERLDEQRRGPSPSCRDRGHEPGPDVA